MYVHIIFQQHLKKDKINLYLLQWTLSALQSESQPTAVSIC